MSEFNYAQNKSPVLLNVLFVLLCVFHYSSCFVVSSADAGLLLRTIIMDSGEYCSIKELVIIRFEVEQ